MSAGHASSDAEWDRWRAWLREQSSNPELIAGCARLGRVLAGGDAA